MIWLPTLVIEYVEPSRMSGVRALGSSLTILPVWGAVLPVSAAWAAGVRVETPVATRTTNSNMEKYLRTRMTPVGKRDTALPAARSHILPPLPGIAQNRTEPVWSTDQPPTDFHPIGPI